MSKVSDMRLSQGIGAVYSVETAAALIPWNDAQARAWLHAEGLVQNRNGHKYVRWVDVLEALGPELQQPTARAHSHLPEPYKI